MKTILFAYLRISLVHFYSGGTINCELSLCWLQSEVVLIPPVFLQVLQKAVDQELYLYSDLKESSHRVAMVMIMSMSSQPIDQDEHRAVRSTDPGIIC